MYMKKKEILKEQKKFKNQNKDTLIDFSDKDDVKKTVFIALGVILFIAIVFVAINILNGTWNFWKRTNDETATIDNKLLMCGTLFQPTDKEYLVLAYKINNDEDEVYKAMIDKYDGKVGLYYLDLESGFNKACISEKSNLVSDSEKIKFNGETLLQIKNGKITKSWTTKDKIEEYLNK